MDVFFNALFSKEISMRRLNCINEQLLQKYIDNECTDIEMTEVNQHIFVCSICAQKLADREKLSADIKKAINSLIK